MTLDERAERVLRSCYMGEMPQDPWVLIAKSLLVIELRDAQAAAYDDCITIAEIAYEPCGEQIAGKLRRRKEQMLNG